MKFAIVINIYIDVETGANNIFDHPTPWDKFNVHNTFKMTLDSINKLVIDNRDELRLYIFAIATNENTNYDTKIRKAVGNILTNSLFSYYLYTNKDIEFLRNYSGSSFFSVSGYPEIRNLGLIIPTIMGEDVIIQIDDDELLRNNYLLRLKEILLRNPDKYIFTAPYEKNGTVEILTEDKLKSWKKYSSMNSDIKRLIKSPNLKETIFGFGGNMIIRRELASRAFYPLEIPRGEDFSFLLATRLIYENGNHVAGIKSKNPLFRAFFIPDKALTIIHKPPYEANKDFLFYLEKNLKRFIIDWNMFIHQKKLSITKLKELSLYVSEMIGFEDMGKKIDDIIKELAGQYDEIRLNKFEMSIRKHLRRYKTMDKFNQYRKNQKKYIASMKRWEMDPCLKQKIIGIGKEKLL